MDRSLRNLPLAISIAASLLLSTLALLLPEADLTEIACAGIALISGLSLLAMTVGQMRRRRFAALLALAANSLGFLVLLTHFWLVRDHVRWLVLSRGYAARVLDQPAPADPGFRHVEWDGWGFAGQDTTVYLVFDPHNSLAAKMNARAPIEAGGLPCAVAGIRRLQSHWYAVLFYTNMLWKPDDCL
jgi:hypothetical protein